MEKELIAGCLKKDRRIQKALYDKYKDAMFSIAYRMMCDFDLAHDVLQEAFIQIFRDIAKFKGESTLGAWIKTIVIRSALNELKKIKPIRTLDEEHDDIPVEWDENLTGEMLEKAIRQLPDGYRAVFVMIEVEGYSHKEVAEMLKISEGTSKSQLFHAKKMLQKRIKLITS